MANYHGWSLAQNQKAHINDPIPIGAIGGDNATPFYINFPQLPAGMQWVFPYVYGFLYPFPVPLYGPLYYDTSTQPAGAQAPPVSTALAQITAYRADAGASFSFAAGTPSISATIVRWTIANSPIAGAQAIATRAAMAGVTHVADFYVGTLTGGTAGGSNLEILDGATAVVNEALNIPAVASSWARADGGPGLGIRGTPGQSMSIQFGAGVAGDFETVNLTGYDQ